MPRVEVSINSGRYLSEDIVTLSCTINLHLSVNSRERVATAWFGPSGQLINSSSITVSDSYAIASGIFQSDVTITNFAPDPYNGDYVCNVTVIPSSPYVVGTEGSDTTRLMISGSYVIIYESPLSTRIM